MTSRNWAERTSSVASERSQYLQLDLLSSYNNNSFISNSETSSYGELISPKLMESLNQRNYFGGFNESKKWQSRIQKCGFSGVSVQAYYSPCGHDISIEPGCNSRICPRCNIRYKRNVIKKIGYIIAQMENIHFLTISPKNYSREEFNSGFALKDLNKIWKALQTKLVQEHGYIIKDFVAVREFKFNEETQWNIHLHIVYDGQDIPQRLISDIMSQVTKGRSRYSYIRSAHSYSGFGHIKTVRYLAKYIGKFEIPNNDLGLITDYYINTKNKKLVTYSHKFDKQKYRSYRLSCPVCNIGKLAQVVGTAKDRLTGETYIFEININYQVPINPPIEEDETHNVLKKISHLLDEKDNAWQIEEILSKEELDYLLKTGIIHELPRGTYRLFT